MTGQCVVDQKYPSHYGLNPALLVPNIMIYHGSLHTMTDFSFSEWVDVCYIHKCTHIKTAGGTLVFPLSLSVLFFDTWSLTEPEASILAQLARQ